jgi:glycosyltransferase involved in cell wall biosynthesis
MTTTLYLTRNGLLEPLGQSQVLPYLRGLAQDYRIILVTREKEEDWMNAEAMAEARAECAALGIDWRPSPFPKGQRFLGSGRDLAAMSREVLRAVRRDGVRLVHARSYIPAAVAWMVSRLSGTPFIFDMRALWPEELITAGRLQRGSIIHRAIVAAERACLRDSRAAVSLTHAAEKYLRQCYAAELEGKELTVIPTCTDLNRFVPAIPPKDRGRTSLVHGCIGTVLSGWFLTGWLAAWLAHVAQQKPGTRFEIVTLDDPASVRAAVDPQGLLGQRLSIIARAPRDMPDVIREHDVSIMFYAGGNVSELGRSPTRMAEVLGSGIPVVVNSGVGDVPDIVRKYNVGVLLESPAPEHLQSALGALEALLAEPDLPARCRAAAEAVFSLEIGTEAYRTLYQRILGQPN